MFTYSAGSKYLYIDNSVLSSIPKRILFTMVKNIDFIALRDTNPYGFQHHDIIYISLFVNGKQFPIEGLSLGTDNEKTSVMGYRTPFEASGQHHSNSGLQITHDIYRRLFHVTLISYPTGSRRRVIHPTLRIAISGSI